MPLEIADDLSFKVPVELLQEFRGEVRLVLRHPWIIGIPAPEVFFSDRFKERYANDFDILLVPKDLQR